MRLEPSLTTKYAPPGSIASPFTPENEACVPTPSITDIEYEPPPASVVTARVDNDI
jgi:hypothetical protein